MVPVALEHLFPNPLVEGDLFPGDLLLNVLQVPVQFWRDHWELYANMVELANELRSLHAFLSTEILPRSDRFRY